MLAWFLRQVWLEAEGAAGMLAWPHSGFAAYLGPRIEDREGLLRVARYCTRSPVAESRRRHDAARAEVERVYRQSARREAGLSPARS